MWFLSRDVSCVAIITSVLVSIAFGADSKKPSLRIIPIGDSITWGYGSSDGNGYRLRLRKLLSDNSVTYLGHWHSGSMSNNNNEGYSGLEISDIETYVKGNGTLGEDPNLILILAGTNDINLDHNASTAPERLGSLIDLVTAACPDATVIVSEITSIWGVDQQERVDAFNAALPGIVAKRNGSSLLNKHVLALNMTSYVTANDLFDGLHPTDVGYQKMAEGWMNGIMQVAERGWLNVSISEDKNDGSGSRTNLSGILMFLAFFWVLMIWS